MFREERVLSSVAISSMIIILVFTKCVSHITFVLKFTIFMAAGLSLIIQFMKESFTSLIAVISVTIAFESSFETTSVTVFIT